jgi:hypothetical protein
MKYAFTVTLGILLGCGGAQPTAESAPQPTEPESMMPKPAATAAASDAPKPHGAGDAPKPAAKPAEAPITSVRLYLTNQCPKPVEYCVEDGSTLNTSLGSNTSTSHTVSVGARIKLKSGSSCGNVIFTAPASKDEQKVTICKP